MSGPDFEDILGSMPQQGKPAAKGPTNEELVARIEEGVKRNRQNIDALAAIPGVAHGDGRHIRKKQGKAVVNNDDIAAGIIEKHKNRYRPQNKFDGSNNPLAKDAAKSIAVFEVGVREQKIDPASAKDAKNALIGVEKELRAQYETAVQGNPFDLNRTKEVFKAASEALEKLKSGIEAKQDEKNPDPQLTKKIKFIEEQQKALGKMENTGVNEELQRLERSITSQRTTNAHQMMAAASGLYTADSVWVNVFDHSSDDDLDLGGAGIKIKGATGGLIDLEDKRYQKRIKDIAEMTDGVFKLEEPKNTGRFKVIKDIYDNVKDRFDKEVVYISVKKGIARPGVHARSSNSMLLHIADKLNISHKKWDFFDDAYRQLLKFQLVKNGKPAISIVYGQDSHFKLEEFKRFLKIIEEHPRKISIDMPPHDMVLREILSRSKEEFGGRLSKKQIKDVIDQINRINKAALEERKKEQVKVEKQQPFQEDKKVRDQVNKEAIKDFVAEFDKASQTEQGKQPIQKEIEGKQSKEEKVEEIKAEVQSIEERVDRLERAQHEIDYSLYASGEDFDDHIQKNPDVGELASLIEVEQKNIEKRLQDVRDLDVRDLGDDAKPHEDELVKIAERLKFTGSEMEHLKKPADVSEIALDEQQEEKEKEEQGEEEKPRHGSSLS